MKDSTRFSSSIVLAVASAATIDDGGGDNVGDNTRSKLGGLATSNNGDIGVDDGEHATAIPSLLIVNMDDDNDKDDVVIDDVMPTAAAVAGGDIGKGAIMVMFIEGDNKPPLDANDNAGVDNDDDTAVNDEAGLPLVNDVCGDGVPHTTRSSARTMVDII
jgi:hypothetical protein